VFEANFKSIFPNPRIIEKKICEQSEPVIEGRINAAELLKYLKDNGCPLVVSIAADGTAIQTRPEYCSSRNSLLGLDLPLSANGFPDSRSSVVEDASAIANLLVQCKSSTSVIVFMAQPLSDLLAPFRLCCFGTGNTYTAYDVQQRVYSIEHELRLHGIRMLTYAADGDSKEMKYMRYQLQLGLSIDLSDKNFFSFSIIYLNWKQS